MSRMKREKKMHKQNKTKYEQAMLDNSHIEYRTVLNNIHEKIT